MYTRRTPVSDPEFTEQFTLSDPETGVDDKLMEAGIRHGTSPMCIVGQVLLDEGAHLPGVGLLFIPAQSTDSPPQDERRTTTHRIDESDPDSYRRYKQWRASKSYNAWNRETHNEKTRERMTMLRARQRLEPPTLQAARLAARQESARKYRENHRELLAAKAAASRAAAKSSRQATSAELSLRMQQRNRLDRALWDIEPTESEQE
ncbi:hypothetical protein B0H14DRAFT_2605683 [Mycena olivaceomarginata]|nr:hypothetical protein B0H14DRAFT_2605683 [Mycena olivaceomarginata]